MLFRASVCCGHIEDQAPCRTGIRRIDMRRGFGTIVRRQRFEVVIFKGTSNMCDYNKEKENTHHDALEFPDGHTLLLTHVAVGQNTTVLQLPARPKNTAEAEAQQRVTYAG